jgi:hypothetical protein
MNGGGYQGYRDSATGYRNYRDSADNTPPPEYGI